MSIKQHFLRHFAYTFILRPLERFGDSIRSIPKLTFQNTQKLAINDEYFDRTEEAFNTWLLSLDNKPKIKPLIKTPIHHSNKQKRVGGKFTKINK